MRTSNGRSPTPPGGIPSVGRKPLNLDDYRDALLMLRHRYTVWIDNRISASEERSHSARADGRYEIASGYEEEYKTFQAARDVFVRMVDEELRRSLGSGSG